MLLQLGNTRHINTLVHEGKMLIVATVQNGSTFELYYTIKQDGFEDSALRPDSMGWEPFRKLALPNEDDDTSVVDKEKETLTDKDGKYLLQSKYKSAGLTADAPVQLVSHDGFVYLFRQSTDKTLLLDRFVLDGMSNTLNRKLEVRFKRSKQRYTPQKSAKISGSGQMNAADSLDFRDIDGKPFHEPSTEILPGILNNIQDGNFAVVVIPTEEKEVYRWHLFATLGDKVTLISLRSGDEQAFDVSDYWFREVDENTNQATYNSIPGIIRRELGLQKNPPGNTRLTMMPGLAAVKYDVQRLAKTSAGEMLTRDASKILLAVPTDQGIAALNFSIALNGTLAEIAPPASVTALRQQEREIPLPLTLMDNIKAIGASREAPGGTISAMQRSAGGIGADCVQVVTADMLDKLQVGNTVTLKNTNSFDGLYTVETAGDGTFRIKADFNDDAMGSWEKVEEETGLVFDGMLTGYSRNADGTLTVNAVNHGLMVGDQVQIVGSPDYDGEYPVIARDDKHFTIQRLWVEGEAVNIKAQSRKRRGLIFDGKQDCVSVPFSDPVKCISLYTSRQTTVNLAIFADELVIHRT